MASRDYSPEFVEGSPTPMAQDSPEEAHGSFVDTASRSSELRGENSDVGLPPPDPRGHREQVASSPRPEQGEGVTPPKGGSSLSDAWSPRTVVIHDASEASSSDGEEDMKDEHGREEILQDEDSAHPELEGCGISGTATEQASEPGPEQQIMSENGRTHENSHGVEQIPTSMKCPCKKSENSENLGNGSNEIQPRGNVQEIVQEKVALMHAWSGDGALLGDRRSMESVTEEHPIIEGSRESFETETGNKQPTAADLLVLAQEVQRLENELAASKSENAAMKELVTSQVDGEDGKSPEMPTEGGGGGGVKASLTQRLKFVTQRLQRDADDNSKHAHLQARLLRAERAVESERERASNLEVKYQMDTKMVENGEKAVQEMSQIKQLLHSSQSENKILKASLEQERNRVELLKAQLSNLISAGATQAENTQQMQQEFEESMKESYHARATLSDLKMRYDTLVIEARDASACAEVSDKLAIDARNDCAMLQQNVEKLTKEKSELTRTVRDQSMQLQRLAGPHTGGGVGNVRDSGEQPSSASPMKATSHQDTQNMSSLPDPPSTEALPDGARFASSDHELVALAQEIERLDQELKSEREARLAAEMALVEKEDNDVHSGIEGQVDNGPVPQAPMKPVNKVVIPHGLADELNVVGNVSPSQVSSEVTIVEPLASEAGRQTGWSRGLWGFLTGSDLTHD